MPVAAGISAAGSIGGGLLGMFGASSASKAQANALQQAVGTLQSMYNTSYNAINPIIQMGTGAAQSVLPTLQNLLTPGANMTKTLSQIPGFQFAQDWGQKAVQNLGTTTGLGGNTLTAGANYATGLAQQGYGNIVGLLENLFQSGGNIATGAASALGNTSAQFGSSISNALGGIGQAQAAGTLGMTNAASNALTGGTNSLANYMMFSPFYQKALAAGQPGLPGMYGGTNTSTALGIGGS